MTGLPPANKERDQGGILNGHPPLVEAIRELPNQIKKLAVTIFQRLPSSPSGSDQEPPSSSPPSSSS